MQFLSILKTSLTTLLRDRIAIFWMLIYPLILLTINGLLLANISNDRAEPILVAIQAENPYYQIYEEIPLIEVRAFSGQVSDQAKPTEQDQITAWIDRDNQIYSYQTSVEVSMVKSLVDSVLRSLALGPAARHLAYDQPLVQDLEDGAQPFKLSLLAILAMYSFYGYFGTSSYCTAISAQQSALGLRHEIAPVSRLTQLSAGLASSLCYSVVLIFILKFHADRILDLNLLPNFMASFPVMLAGALAGSSIGLLVGSLPGLSDNFKIISGVVISLVLAFLSGMMSPDIYNLISDRAPIFLQLNPLSCLTTSLFYVNFIDSSYPTLPTIIYLCSLAIACILLASSKLVKLQHQSLA